MSQKNVFDTLRARGSEMFSQLAGHLMQNPQFVKAMQGAMQGKAQADRLVGRALKQMNIPTRSEFKRALGRIEQLESEVADLKARPETTPKSRTARSRKK